MIESPPDFEKDPERWYRWAFSRYPLTHKDKLDLNRRARAHGLPDLWPEAERMSNDALRAWMAGRQNDMDWLGLGGMGAPPPGWSFGIGTQPGWQGGVEGMQNIQPPPRMTETAAEAVERFRREGSDVPRSRSGLGWSFRLRTLFGFYS